MAVYASFGFQIAEVNFNEVAADFTAAEFGLGAELDAITETIAKVNLTFTVPAADYSASIIYSG